MESKAKEKMESFFKIKDYTHKLMERYALELPQLAIATEFLQGIIDRFQFPVGKEKAVRLMWSIIEHYTFSVIRFEIDEELISGNWYRFWKEEMGRFNSSRELIYGSCNFNELSSN